MSTFKAIGIKWDCDGVSPKHYNLPKDATIEAEDEDDVVDALSDQYGFCIFGVKHIINLNLRNELIAKLTDTLNKQPKKKIMFTDFVYNDNVIAYTPKDFLNTVSAVIGRRDVEITKVILYNNQIYVESYDGNLDRFFVEISKVSTDDLESLVAQIPLVINADFKDVPCETIQYHSEPTMAECKAGYGCMHYRSFPWEIAANKRSHSKRSIKDENGRMWYYGGDTF